MLSSGSILVVDHEPTIVDLLVEILTDAGYVAYAAVGACAPAAIALHLPALILLDMHIPSLSGAELIAQIRAVSSALAPIVLMTTTSPDARPLLGVGAIEYLTKPFDIDDLLTCVGRYVQPFQAANQPYLYSYDALAETSRARPRPTEDQEKVYATTIAC